MEDAKFIEQVNKEMQEIKANHTVNDAGDQFAIWFGKMILGFEEDNVAEEYHIGGAGDDKIDLGIVSSESETKIIVQCKFTAQPLSKTYNKDLIDEVLAARRRISDSPESGNEKRREFVKQYSASSKPERLIAVGFGDFTPDAIAYAANTGVEIYDFARLKREYLLMLNPARIRPPQSVTLRVSSSQVFEYRENNAHAYVVSLPAREIYKILSEEKIGPGIFQDNLRYQLRQQKSSTRIATAIRKTVSESPENLLILNNGITFTCHKVRLSKSGSSKNFTLCRPQIVNGCQTAYAICEAMNNNSNETGKDAYVLAKIVDLEHNSQIDVARITESTNSQNRITERDQFANSDLQIEIKAAFQHYKPPIFYECKNGEWDLTVKRNKAGKFKLRRGVFRRIDNETAARVYLALMGLPAAAKNTAQSTIFMDEKYRNAIFGYDIPPATRFSDIDADEPKLDSGLDNFVEDVVFGYAIKKLSEAVVVLFKRKQALYEDTTDFKKEFEDVKSKEFLRYWHSHVIRLMHYVIEKKVKGDSAKRKELRQLLIGEDISYVFDTAAKLADKLPFDSDLSKHTILKSNDLSHPLGLFACWFENLSAIAMEIAESAKSRNELTSYINYFAKRRETGEELTRKVR